MGKFQPGQSGNPGGRPKAIREVIEAAQAEGIASIRALADIRDDGNAPHAARATAAGMLLDRGFGKPTVTVEHRDHRDVADYTDAELRLVIAERSAGGAGVAVQAGSEGKPH